MGGGYWELVGRAVDAIEADIGAPLTLDSISRQVGLSKFHLHRLFKALTGRSLMAYVRGRKLSRSLVDLLDTGRSVLDIACDYGFEYEQTYERAFRHLFQVSPSGFRREKPQVRVVPVPDLANLNRMDDGVLISPSFVMKPRFHLAGIEHEVVHAENHLELTANRLARDFFYKESHAIPNIKHPSVYYGLVRYTEHSGYSNYYMPSVEVSRGNPLPLPFTVRTLPTQTYAVFKYVGFHSPEQLTIRTLQQLYTFIFGTWLPGARFRLAQEWHFERMDLKLCTPEYCEADIYVPVDG